MYRVDHQVNGSNSWALRLMNETSPETNRYGNRTLTSGHDGWDDEHIWVGSYTSVIGNNIVNTVRITRSYENVGGGSPRLVGSGRAKSPQRADAEPDARLRDGQLLGRDCTVGGRPHRLAVAVQQHHVVVRPRQDGRSRHQVGRHLPPGVHRRLPRELPGRPVPFQHRQAVRHRRLLDLPRTAPDSRRQGERPAVRLPHQHVGGVPAGQVDAERTLDGGARRPVGRRDAERGGDRQSADGAGDRPARLEQHLAAVVDRLRRDRRRPVRHPGGLRGTSTTGRSSADSTTSCRIRSTTTRSPPTSPAGAAARAGRRTPGRGTTCRSRTPSWRERCASAWRRTGSAGRRPSATA